MKHPVVSRLAAFGQLSRTDEDLIAMASRGSIRDVASRHELVAAGDRPESVLLLLEGWACRYRYLDDGQRQLLSFILPGEPVDRAIFCGAPMDHGVGAVTAVKVAVLAPEEVEALIDASPRISWAWWCLEMTEMAVQREWTVSLGKRSSHERVAHLICELHARLEAIGLATDGRMAFPLTQVDIADAAGLTAVHVNRMMKQLRAEGLVETEGRILHLPDPDRLAAVAGFDPAYLRLASEAE